MGAIENGLYCGVRTNLSVHRRFAPFTTSSDAVCGPHPKLILRPLPPCAWISTSSDPAPPLDRRSPAAARTRDSQETGLEAPDSKPPVQPPVPNHDSSARSMGAVPESPRTPVKAAKMTFRNRLRRDPREGTALRQSRPSKSASAKIHFTRTLVTCPVQNYIK